MGRSLAESREQARQLIEQRQVLVNGAIALKAARRVRPADVLEVRRKLRFVSRGGDKLQAALDEFGVLVEGRDCLDLGASTGGFTDCLLQAGAAKVRAVDVGRNLLHERLLGLVEEGRVEVYDGVNVRLAEPQDVGGPAELVVVDLSFISLQVVMGRLAEMVVEGGDLVALVKPQFEAGQKEVARARGVIKSDEIRQRVVGEVSQAATEAGFLVRGVVPAPQASSSKNVEFLLHAVRSV